MSADESGGGGPHLSPPTRAGQFARTVGRRNVAYVAGTLVLAVLALAIELESHGFDRGSGIMLAMMAWMGGSLLFFGGNALLVLGWIVDQIRGGVPMIASPVSRALIGCMLPVLTFALGMALVS